MNKYLTMFSVCCLVGCHHEIVQQPQPINNQPPTVVTENNTYSQSQTNVVATNTVNQQASETKAQEDGFDTAGKAVANGSRTVWNASKQAYEYVTSDETKNKMIKVWQQTKKLAVETKQTIQEKLTQ